MNTKRNLSFISLIIILLALFVSGTPSLAQNYFFAVPEMRMEVFVEPDASALIKYDITFENVVGYSPIDIVDIGTPHDNYDLSQFRASINGVPLTDIRVSEYIDTGVEIHLHDQQIPGGQRGTLQVEFPMPDMVYQDTTQDGFASFQISPTGFDSNLVSGTTDIWIAVHLLPEVNAEQVLYQDVPFSDKVIFDEHPVVAWRWPDGRVDNNAPQNYRVGVSFPDTGMSRVIEQNLFDIVQKWLADNPEVMWILGGISFFLLAIAFFRFSGGTGFSVFALLACGLLWFLFNNPMAVFLALPAAFALFGFAEFKLAGRKETYLPAIAQVEGGGIKRGLTAPEAAILLELPLNKVLLLVLFGLLDKGAVSLEDDSPLKVKVERPYVALEASRKKRTEKRRQIAQQQGIVLRSYEHKFLDVLQENEGEPVHKLNFSDPMKSLIQSVVDRMKGFDLSDTKDYYKKIIARAMEQANRLGEIPELESHLDKTWPWIFLDDDYDRTFRRRGYEYHPVWVRPYVHPTGSGGLPTSGKSSGPAYGGKTGFGEVAASFAGWTEKTAGSIADAISPGALQVKGAGGGIINLGGADKVTGDIFSALASSSGSSGGSSGGSSCACACAGCACACACAGGGR